MMHAIAYRRDVYMALKLRFDEVACREDFNITLRLLRAGLNNVVCYDYCVSPAAYNASGGASMERTVQSSNREAERLAKLHPDFVRLVDREYKNVPRKEVVVYWKRAYQSGLSA